METSLFGMAWHSVSLWIMTTKEKIHRAIWNPDKRNRCLVHACPLSVLICTCNFRKGVFKHRSFAFWYEFLTTESITSPEDYRDGNVEKIKLSRVLQKDKCVHSTAHAHRICRPTWCPEATDSWIHGSALARGHGIGLSHPFPIFKHGGRF